MALNETSIIQSVEDYHVGEWALLKWDSCKFSPFFLKKTSLSMRRDYNLRLKCICQNERIDYCSGDILVKMWETYFGEVSQKVGRICFAFSLKLLLP